MAQLTNQQIVAELRRRGVSDAQMRAKGIKQSDIDAAPSQAGTLESFFTGAGQGLSDTGISAANAAIIAGNEVGKLLGGNAPVAPTIPHPSLERALNIDTSGHPMANMVGNLAGGSVIPGGTYLKALKLLPEAKGLAGLAVKSAAGAGSGAITGEQQDGSGRAMGTILGGALAPAAGIAGGLGRAARTLTQSDEKLGQTFKNTAAAKSDISTENYKKALAEGTQVPVGIPEIKPGVLGRIKDDDLNQSLGDFLSKPNVITAHKAQSDIGAELRSLKKGDPGLRSNEDRNHIKRLEKLRMDIRKSISQGFHDVGQHGKADAYDAATKFYVREVVPYTRNRTIRDFLAGETSPQYALKNLSGGGAPADKFRKAMGASHPEIDRFAAKKALQSKLKKAALYSLVGAIGIPGIHHLEEIL